MTKPILIVPLRGVYREVRPYPSLSALSTALKEGQFPLEILKSCHTADDLHSFGPQFSLRTELRDCDFSIKNIAESLENLVTEAQTEAGLIGATHVNIYPLIVSDQWISRTLAFEGDIGYYLKQFSVTAQAYVETSKQLSLPFR
ncbi:hypothetical protein J4228_00085 [Candidatus Woesearchaeota archaeon]|nr:hypothetical protein [Candidatus Woesearchaeota archaeon]